MPASRPSRRLALGLLLGLVAGACSRGSTGASGSPPGRARVVSLSPSTTEALYAIGAGDLLVGRSEQCDEPAEARRLPSVGGFAEPDLERIASLRPTLVVGERGPFGLAFVERLAAENVATFFPPTRTVAEISAMLGSLGERVGHAAEAARVRGRLERAVQRIEQWAAGRPTVSVVMVFDLQPLFVAGPGNFPGELLRQAGGRNLVDKGGEYPTIDVERLLTLDPEVIIDAIDVTAAGPSTLPGAPGWAELGAVRAGKVRRLRSAAALRPGPRIAAGLAAVAEALHGVAPPAGETTASDATADTDATRAPGTAPAPVGTRTR